MANKFRNSILLSWAQILIGLLATTAAYRCFLIPCEIAPGGFTGIGQLVNKFTHWPIGLIALALNIPLFALSYKRLGVRFAIRSLFASAALSFAIDWLPMQPVTTDKLLGMIYGGVIGGFGLGLILRGGATTGGSDMLGKLISRRAAFLSVGAVTFLVDGLVIAASGLVFDLTSAMFALIGSFLMNRVLDTVLEGPNLAKAYYIISDKNDEIARRIMTDVNRGVTKLQGTGMYSGKERGVLLCVVGRLEAVQIRCIVAALDKNAFMIATDVREAIGEGFKSHIE